MLVSVTEADIANGEKHNCVACPVALALKRAGGYEAVRAWPDYAMTKRKNRAWRAYAMLPPAVRSFMRSYDSHLPVEPFSFEFEEAA